MTKRKCPVCCGSGFTFGDDHARFRETCINCQGKGEIEMNDKGEVFFALYDRDAMRNKTFEEARNRTILDAPHRFIRIRYQDDGDGMEIKSADFVTEESLADEATSHNSLIDQLRADAAGEIEG